MNKAKYIQEGNKLVVSRKEFSILLDFMPEFNRPTGDYETTEIDWNTLMPVVEKICKIKCMWDNVEPHELDTYYPRTFGMLNEKTKRPMVRLNSCPLFEADTLIEAMWLAIVDFIKFYNQNKTS